MVNAVFLFMPVLLVQVASKAEAVTDFNVFSLGRSLERISLAIETGFICRAFRWRSLFEEPVYEISGDILIDLENLPPELKQTILLLV